MERVTYNRKEGYVRDLLMLIKYNDISLFISMEQGKGKRSNATYLLMTPKLRTDA